MHPSTVINSCPGFYCGRVVFNGSVSVCGSCPRGSRASSAQICLECQDSPELYDWIYLFFIVLMFIVVQFNCVDRIIRTSRPSFVPVFFYLSILFECVVASVGSLLLFEPRWQFDLRTCHVEHFSDWYTLFYNPPSADEPNCTQEAVYPLYSILFVFYFLSLFLVLCRPIYLRAILFLLIVLTRAKPVIELHKNIHAREYITQNVYFTLYSIPVLLFVHSTLAGIIYYIFPYLITLGSIFSIAFHLSHHIDQSPKYLLLTSLHFRNLLIVLFHWSLHTFSIVALTGLRNPQDYLYFVLVPMPTLFYILTSKFTHPEALWLDLQYPI